ncbi:Cmx/CmrA family chloramphenicol efflux MFS transporter [Actinophytocola sp.]|uniref:Cmx/CmrA family chloramphenicol efflux MFS transporter n=1 Tax=Actinophytocola sp. TaxID=1872138 RepID=UPI002ED14543
MPLFVYVLSLAVFAQGTSEFMLSGLVPGIADDLSVSVAAAASLTSAYAIGMVAGAPVMAGLSARWPRRRALAVFLTAFVVAHVVGAVTHDFAVLFGTRVVAAVANAGFLAVAMSAAATVAGPGRQARATAVLIAGVTLSCVAGVPAGALLGQLSGWRSAFWAVAGLSLPALFLVFRSAPVEPAGHVLVRKEFRVLLRWPVWHALVLAALVNGATFATFAYLAVVATAIPSGAVPALLAAFGAGAFVGVTVIGPSRHLVPVLFALPVGWLLLAVASPHPVTLFAMTVVQGALSFGAGSALVNRVLSAAPEAPTLGGSFATVALNIGAVLGPLLTGAIDHRHAMWLSSALSAVALVLLPLRGREPDDLRIVQSGR